LYRVTLHVANCCRRPDPAQLWTFYVQLTEVEQAFKELKHDLSIRPIHHHEPRRIEAHVFVAFLAYCLQVTLKANLRPAAGGITPREVIDKFKTMQMVDVHLPTVDGRELILSRHTQPEADHRMLLEKLRLALPEQPPPKNHGQPSPRRCRAYPCPVVKTLGIRPNEINNLASDLAAS